LGNPSAGSPHHVNPCPSSRRSSPAARIASCSAWSESTPQTLNPLASPTPDTSKVHQWSPVFGSRRGFLTLTRAAFACPLSSKNRSATMGPEALVLRSSRAANGSLAMLSTLEEVATKACAPLLALQANLEASPAHAGVLEVPAEGCPHHASSSSRIQTAPFVHGPPLRLTRFFRRAPSTRSPSARQLVDSSIRRSSRIQPHRCDLVMSSHARSFRVTTAEQDEEEAIQPREHVQGAFAFSR
jgi:hypothetical protein